MKYQQPFAIDDPGAPYINGNPGAGIEGSIPRAEAFEHHLRELVHLITWANGLRPDMVGLPSESDLQQVRKAIGAMIAAATRTRLLSSVTAWVRTDGNDNNDGSANTAGSAFATIQGGWNRLKTLYDLSGNSLTFQLGNAGTYAGVYFDNLGVVGNIRIVGDVAAEGGYIVTPATAVTGRPKHCVASEIGTVTMSGVTLDASSATGVTRTVWAPGGGKIVMGDRVTLKNTVNNSSLIHVDADNGGTVTLQAGANISIIGGASPTTVQALFAGQIYGTVVIGDAGAPCLISTSNIAIGEASALAIGGSIIGQGATFSGSVTGKRYRSAANAVITTNGGGANFFPGSIAGTVDTGGQYL